MSFEIDGNRVGEEALRWSLVVIFLLFGTAKFAAYEAEGVARIASDYWLFFWLYPLGGVQFASNMIGALELGTGLLLGLGSRYPLPSLAGGVMGICTFLVTLSFLLIAPTTFEQGYGFPFLGSSGQFLMKDLVLLAACLNLTLISWKRVGAKGMLRQGRPVLPR